MPESIKSQASKRRAISLDAAIDSISTYFQFDPIETIEIDGELFDVRFSVAWSPEQTKAFEELDEFVKTLDHEDVANRNKDTGEILLNPKTGEVDSERLPKMPHQKDGEPIEPSYGFRYLTAMFGSEERAMLAEAGGLTYNLVQALVGKMGDQWVQFQKNRDRIDHKSN